ncbi:PREDICTED: very-long-chain (3R)-3-hydroxyacyl-CoA dehydratase 2 [Dinoponera quadriceps]|uniref:Very-long-chain (3R)-3-hydroxyacyl-CoA dehydratase n=1 Tax=Dinoponera quadriceps TaxID=609295 RepID=A0A6P3Y888_DINQU|nr:PREDICTED: very-long-chain (3R)-3-hydroxyacyl-CoA dehydratase 2 [Dinoponera quadriceps]
MTEVNSKKPGILAKFYLALYNLGQTLGWSYILYQFIQHHTNSSLDATLWNKVELSLFVFQNAAVLEIMHAATGLVPSNTIITIFQVLSRIMIVVGVILATPYTYAAASPGIPLILTAWSITEIIRYFYYFLNLLNAVPYIIIWLRYTTFIILYPIGITGELLCYYAAVKYASAYSNAWSYVLPNTWNFTFSYLYLLIGAMLSYIPIFPKLYMHMFAQRRKILNPAATKKVH